MNQKQRLYKLVKFGFFPEELPPEFGLFGLKPKLIGEIINCIDTFDKAGNQKRKSTSPIEISYPKTKLTRRQFHILNPVHFFRLGITITDDDNRKAIEQITDKSAFSTSKIDLSEKAEDLFYSPPFSKSVKQKIARSCGKMYVLKLDISNYFPSIYTHTLSWIFNNGEKLPKKQWNDRSINVGTALDQDIRAGQKSETNGIVIGPATSIIVSEIIGSYLDSRIQSAFHKVSGIRYVDDYALYFDSLREIEDFHVFFQLELSKFKLSINESKTYYTELPEVFEEKWVSFLRQYNFDKEKSYMQKNDLVTLFSYCFDLIKGDAKNHSLKYLYSIFQKKGTILQDNIEEFVNLTFHALSLDPRCFSRAGIAIGNHKFLIKKNSHYFTSYEHLLDRTAKSRKSFESIWLMHFMLHTRTTVSSDIIESFISNRDLMPVFFALNLYEYQLISEDDFKAIKSFLKEEKKKVEDLWRSDLWLIAYEDNIRNWGIFNDKIEGTFFEVLKNNNIRFIASKPIKDWTKVRRTSYFEVKEIQDE